MKSRRENLQSFNHGKRKEGQERFFTADEVEGLLSYLSRQNSRGVMASDIEQKNLLPLDL